MPATKQKCSAFPERRSLKMKAIPKEAGKSWQSPGTSKWTVIVDLWSSKLRFYYFKDIQILGGSETLRYAREWGSTMTSEVRPVWQMCDKRSHKERRHEYHTLLSYLSPPKGFTIWRNIFWVTTKVQTVSKDSNTEWMKAVVQRGGSKSRSLKYEQKSSGCINSTEHPKFMYFKY
jgi:hypothetical protein